MGMKKIPMFFYKKLKPILSRYRLVRFYPFGAIHNAIIKKLRPSFLIIEGHKIFLDPKDSLGLFINRDYEKFETNLLKKEVKNLFLILGAELNGKANLAIMIADNLVKEKNLDASKKAKHAQNNTT